MSTRSYDYSPAHRALEIVSILGLAVLVTLLFYEAWLFLRPTPDLALGVLAGSAFVAYLAADFASGFIHFMGDTFGDENTPVIGPTFIFPFREHHVLPRKITEHDFVETNGNNCVVCVPAAYLVWQFCPAREALLWAAFSAFVAWFMIWIFMTNQFHKWSHLEEPPAWIAKLQTWRVILEPGHHDIHHTPPFDTYYCITTGWLNPLLYKLNFFRISERLIRVIFRIPRPALAAEPAAPVREPAEQQG